MTIEFLPPDPRLDDKVKIVRLRPNARPGRGNGGASTRLKSDTPDDKPVSPEDVEISRLAKLGTLEYERERKDAAERLNTRTTILDRLVAAEREQPDDGKQGRSLSLPEPEPWPDPVNGAELLDSLSASIRGYVIMSDYTADTSAMWTVHTYLLDVLGISPRLAVKSPEKGCGKTTLLDVLSCLVQRPLPTANATVSAVFRVVEMRRPTLLIDEGETFLLENEELRGILNSGHRRGGSVIRTVGDDFEPRSFSTYSACAIALIGRLPTTLEDRSVSVELRRRLSDEAIEAFRFDRTQRLHQLARKAARWAADNTDAIRDADPDMPAGVFNRMADNWRPLLAIADAVGGEWPTRARRAIQRGTALVGGDEQSVRALLLADIRTIFAERGAERLASADLVEALAAIEGRPWAEWKAGKPITANSLARLLAPFAIVPDTIRLGDRTPKGMAATNSKTPSRVTFHNKMFEAQHRNNRDATGITYQSTTATTGFVLRFEKYWKPAWNGHCGGVADQNIDRDIAARSRWSQPWLSASAKDR